MVLPGLPGVGIWASESKRVSKWAMIHGKKSIKLLKLLHSHYDSHFSFFFLLLHNFQMVPQAFTVDGGETAHASDLPCSPCASSCVQNVDKKLCNSEPVQLSFSPCFIPRLLRMRTRFQKHVLLRSSLEPTTRILGRRPWADSLRPSLPPRSATCRQSSASCCYICMCHC